MSHHLSSSDSSLLVRNVAGDYRPAHADEVLQAAHKVHNNTSFKKAPTKFYWCRPT